jgi:hypothetical protein
MDEDAGTKGPGIQAAVKLAADNVSWPFFPTVAFSADSTGRSTSFLPNRKKLKIWGELVTLYGTRRATRTGSENQG